MVNTTARQSKGKYPKKPVRIESEKWKTSSEVQENVSDHVTNGVTFGSDY